MAGSLGLFDRHSVPLGLGVPAVLSHSSSWLQPFEGERDKEIVAAPGLGAYCARNHIRKLFTKRRACRQAEAVHLTQEIGLVSDECWASAAREHSRQYIAATGHGLSVPGSGPRRRHASGPPVICVCIDAEIGRGGPNCSSLL